MIEFDSFYHYLQHNQLSHWVAPFKQRIDTVLADRHHGLWEQWRALHQQLPQISPTYTNFNHNRICIGQSRDLENSQPPITQEQLKALLKQWHPWRKGPYQLFDTHIDTEWRSDWKWERIAAHLSPLENRRILDVGCGNGYHAWRMLGAGAKLVIGADPSQFFLHQFHLIKHFAGQQHPIFLIPLKSEEMPKLEKGGFDTVFSMGVLYHRRSPIDHLYELKQCLRPGGELVMETLVIDGDENTALIPQERYGKMRNVWFIPSVAHLVRWMERAGFINLKVVDITQTTTQEQRSTEWMTFESLPDFLDPTNNDLTIEGYPAPKRATIIGERPK